MTRLNAIGGHFERGANWFRTGLVLLLVCASIGVPALAQTTLTVAAFPAHDDPFFELPIGCGTARTP